MEPNQSAQPIPPVQEPQAPEPQIATVEPVKKRFSIIWIVVIILVLVLITLLGYFAYTQYLKPNNSQQNTNNNTNQENNSNGNNNGNNEEEENNAQPEDVTLSKDKMFYANAEDKNNIYSYDLNTKTSIKLTSFTENTEVKSLSVFGSNFLSYGICKTVVNDYGCSLKTFDLNTLIETELLKLPKTTFLHAFKAYSKDKYAYLSMTYKAGSLDKFQLTYMNNGVSKLLENISANGEYGRGGFDEDSEKLLFSPDSTKLLHISTSSPRSSMDFNTYVYDLEAGSKVKIATSTQPSWINNSKIVYRKPQSNDSGLYIYDLDTKQSEKLVGVGKQSFDPRVSQDSKTILYSDYVAQKLYLYDMDAKNITTVIDTAVDGLWINEDTFVYQKTGKCIKEDDCPMSTYKRLNLVTLNAKSNAKVELKIDYIYLVASALDNR